MLADRLVQALGVPLLGVGLLGDVLLDQLVDHLMAHVDDRLADVVLAHDVERAARR